MKLWKTLFLISLIVSVNACVTIKEVPVTIVFPVDPSMPALVNIDVGDTLVLIQGDWNEKDYYIIQNASTIQHYRHNFLVMMSYSQRLQDYLDLIKKQNI